MGDPEHPPREQAGATRLVLASSSPRRAELLARIGVFPTVRAVDIDESQRPGEDPGDLVLRLASEKATASAGLGTGDEVVLAADTIVVLDGRVMTKPATRADALRMLSALSGRTHEVMTGVAVRRAAALHALRVTTRVSFRTLGEDEIAWYVATGEPDGKAGGYALQGAGGALVDHIEGSDTNVIGLPLAATVSLLREAGLELLRASPSPER